ncbi:3TM-type holin [Rubinisphaera margarita]
MQADINKVEAGHASIFVAGWRPFIGWVRAALTCFCPDGRRTPGRPSRL